MNYLAISDGLAFYAKFKAISSIVITSIFFILSLFYISYIYKLNYINASNSKITYKTSHDGKDCDSDDLKCRYFVEYSDSNNNKYVKDMIVNPKIKPTIGSTSVFYPEKNPERFDLSPIHPAYFSYGISIILIFVIAGSCLNYYFISINKSYATIQGGIDIVNNFIPKQIIKN